MLEALFIFWPAQKVASRSIEQLESTIGDKDHAIQRLSQFTDLAADLFWETDLKGRITFLGGRILRDFARATDDLIGLMYLDVVRLHASEMAKMDDIISKLASYSGIMADFTDGNGRVFQLELSGKPKYDRAGRLNGYMGIGDDVTAKVKAQEDVRRLAEQDALTGLANRHAYSRRLDKDLSSLAGQSQQLALLAIDLDGFKGVNDTFGHDVGDRLLEMVSRRILTLIGDRAWAARLGGDEFVIVYPGINSTETAEQMAEGLNAVLAEPYQIGPAVVHVNASTGIAVAPTDASSPQRLMKCADVALYQAKAAGRGCFRVYNEDMTAASHRQKQLELRLRSALKDDLLEVVYQPIIDLETRRTTGFEALARWNDSELGIVQPRDFVKIAEGSGLVIELGEQILRRACFEAATWPRDAYGVAPRLSVNISPAQLMQNGLVNSVKRILADSRLPAKRLELEITDNLLIDDVRGAVQTLHDLAAMGIGISIDDFGTGYSSLGRLGLLPLSRLKIDKSIVHQMATDRNSLKIVRGIVSLAEDLDMAIVAEGVETERQLDLLEAAGCGEAQGFYFSPALTDEQVMVYLKRSKSDDFEPQRRTG